MNATQRMVFAGLRSIGGKGQINALATDAAGDVYLAFDQGDGIRVLKVANDGGALLAQVQLGATGDTATALALDVSGDVYLTGTSTSGSLQATSGAAISLATAGTANSFVAKFDERLNETFLTFTGGTRIVASAIAASADSVIVTGITYASDLPVSSSGIQQAPATGTFQNGFVESFSADGTTLKYSTYISGAQGDSTPTGIAVDAGDDAWLVGSTTASGFPTIAAVVPEMLSTPSGFLLQLTPSGDGIVYSTFIPGAGLSSVALDSTGLNLWVSGQVALGQFPVDTVTGPLVPTAYQVLLQISLDGSTVESGTVIAPGLQSVVTAAAGGAAWIGGSFTPGAAPLLPGNALSTIGNSYAVHLTPGVGVDQTVRLGGLANFDQTYASVPVAIDGLAVDGTGALFAGGFAQPTASANLLSTETYDFPLLGGPTAALPSVLTDAEAASASCGGSLCSGSGAYLAKVDPLNPGPALALSANAIPVLTLRNLGSLAANDLQLTTTTGTLSGNCTDQLPPGGECDILLSGGGSGTLTAIASNGGSTSTSFAAYPNTKSVNGIVFAPKELDFGIWTAASGTATRTITVTNLGSSSATFSEGILATPEFSTPFSEVASNCPLASNTLQKSLGAGASCTITIGFRAFQEPGNDGFVEGEWTLGAGQIFLTGFSQAANLSVSAAEVDFATQFEHGLSLPRYLYLSNSSSSVQSHAQVDAPANSPFSLQDECPAILPPGNVCRIRIDYLSSVAPSIDSLTLMLDQGLSVLVTGKTIEPQTTNSGTRNANLSASPASVTFGNAVIVTGVSSVVQTVSLTNSGMGTVPLSLAVSGDFTEVTSCQSSLAAGSSCEVAVTFTPSEPGVRQGLLTITSGVGTSPITVPLSGTGIALFAATNGTLDFNGSPVGQPVVQFYKVKQPFDTLSLQTTGPFLATLVEDQGFGFGDPPSSDYISAGSGTCHNCWVGVQFQGSAAGEQAGTLTFTSTASGLPYVLRLSGAASATSGLVLSPAMTDFGPTPVKSLSGAATFTLTNLVGTGETITISEVTTSGDFQISPSVARSGTCVGELPFAASCFVSVQFAPSITGTRSGSLSIGTDLGIAALSLAGTGTSDLGLAVSPLALTFANAPDEFGDSQTVSLRNTGPDSITVSTATTGTTNFSVSSGCGTLASGASCSLQVGFLAGANPISDILSIPVFAQSGAGQAPRVVHVGLSGTFTTADEGLALFPGTITFGPVATSTVGSARQVTVTNLTSKQVSISVTMPQSYELQANTCATLAPAANCVLTITFVPLENGDLPGTISVAARATDGSQSSTALLYADGFGVGTGVLTISGGLIVNGVFDFGSVAAGQSASQVFKLTNMGTNAINVRRVQSETAFHSTTNCAEILAPGVSCSATVVYAPQGGASAANIVVPTPDLGLITVSSDAQSSPNVLDVRGQSTARADSGGVSTLSSFAVSEGALSFLPTTVGDTSIAQNLILTNTGNSALQISSASTTSDFAVKNGCMAVPVGASCTIVVASTPQSAGGRLAGLEISSNAASSLDYVTLLGSGIGSPLVFSPATLLFGSVPIGSKAVKPLTVTNSSNNVVTFSSIATGGAFAVTGNCPDGGGALAARATCTEQVTFTPGATGSTTAAVSFNTSASTGPLQVQLSGTGIQPQLTATPASLWFGGVPLGASANLALQLTNHGSGPVSGLMVSGSDAYTVTVPCVTPILAAGASCSIQVTFTPTGTGASTGTLTIASSDPASPLKIPLSGTGLVAPGFSLTVNGSSTGAANVTSGAFVAFDLLLTPSGGFDGDVALTCEPVQPAAYASCSVLPSQLHFTGGDQSSTATINTEESSTGSLRRESWRGSALACVVLMVPGILIRLDRSRMGRGSAGFLVLLICLLLGGTLSGCGGGSASGTVQHKTPPGRYQFQVTASSTGGPVLTRTVLLEIVVVSP